MFPFQSLFLSLPLFLGSLALDFLCNSLLPTAFLLPSHVQYAISRGSKGAPIESHVIKSLQPLHAILVSFIISFGERQFSVGQVLSNHPHSLITASTHAIHSFPFRNDYPRPSRLCSPCASKAFMFLSQEV
ncbi:hypothetical protein CALVIDRAFT_416917 [Calocera viscosa TUFC12733]|uniref:Secreted protein n=1 Tax=Calocera viscosa (strain TUFC12733) TaxID=1330018 RepID=A0A167PFJ9_CALVF|nr:hypothetical protein CALVIDRAFT_416917 [Calocera viscosa TUFC12733]